MSNIIEEKSKSSITKIENRSKRNNTFSKISILFIILFLISAACFLSGCIDHYNDHDDLNNTGTTNTGEKITITDAMGRTVTVPKNPQRIALSGSGSGRYFGYLMQTDKVVAIDILDSSSPETDTRPYMLANKDLITHPILGTAKGVVDAERLLKVSPDLVFMAGYSPDVVKSADTIQEKTGIPVLVFYSGDYVKNSDRVDDSLRMIGKVLECGDRAEEVIKYFRDIEKDLNERVKDVPDEGKPTVYVGGISYSGAHGLYGTDPAYLAFTVLHAKNVASEMVEKESTSTGFAKASKEKILEWDPDIIFIDLGTIGAAGGGAIVELQTDPSYKKLKAARTGEVYALNPHTYCGTNHETSLANAYYVGKVLYPEQFKDIDPEEKADEIYEFILGKPVYSQIKKNTGGLSYQKVKI